MKPYIHLALNDHWPAEKVPDILVPCETSAVARVTVAQCLACPRICSAHLTPESPVKLYPAIKEGRKKVEHRACNKHNLMLLTGRRRVPVSAEVVKAALDDKSCTEIDLTKHLRSRTLYLTRGYPAGLKPRLECHIERLAWTRDGLLDLHLDQVREVI